ncbi:hypothetical protein [Amycolatopsis sp. cg9]|uniref:hypothetical protein n=1 Tax=Amycolatopsis sp. cg9 TaxID=3238801 RepID=UPI003525336B
MKQSYKRAVSAKFKIFPMSNCSHCDPKKLANFVSFPLTVILENVETDGAWLRMLVAKLRPALKRFFDVNPPHVELYNAGGIGEIPKALSRVVEERSKAGPVGTLPRVMAVADSDAKSPGAPANNAVEVSRKAQKLGVISHVLSKRTIENYIPDRALLAYCEKRVDRRPAGLMITSLGREARDHYPMKEGLSGGEIAVSKIYPANTMVKLGLGDFVLDLLNNFYHTIEVHDLHYRDGKNELNGLLDTLEGNL